MFIHYCTIYLIINICSFQFMFIRSINIIEHQDTTNNITISKEIKCLISVSLFQTFTLKPNNCSIIFIISMQTVFAQFSLILHILLCPFSRSNDKITQWCRWKL